MYRFPFIGLLLAASTAGAQVQFDGAVAYLPHVGAGQDYPGYQQVCGTPGVGTAQAFDYACGIPPYGLQTNGDIGGGRVAASGTAGGTLHAYARVGWSFDDPWVDGVIAQSYASYTDRITFGAELPAYLRFTVQLHGTLQSAVYGCDVASGQLCGGDGTAVASPYASYGWLQLQGGDRTKMLYRYATDPELQTATWDMKVEPWMDPTGFDFKVTLGAFVSAIPGMFSVADFGNTAFVSSIRAVSASGCDASEIGCDITAQIQRGGITSASGATYDGFTAPATTTPEPATLALLGSGLVGVLGWRRVRR